MSDTTYSCTKPIDVNYYFVTEIRSEVISLFHKFVLYVLKINTRANLFEAQDPNSNETGFDNFKDQVRHISYNKEGFFVITFGLV